MKEILAVIFLCGSEKFVEQSDEKFFCMKSSKFVNRLKLQVFTVLSLYMNLMQGKLHAKIPK